MMLTSAARSLDAWLTREPDWDGEPLPAGADWPRCGGCGGFLRRYADWSEPGEETRTCAGTAHEPGEPGYETDCGRMAGHDRHEFVAWAWDILHRICRNHRGVWACRRDNTEVIP